MHEGKLEQHADAVERDVWMSLGHIIFAEDGLDGVTGMFLDGKR